jgi:hypothetical protein
MGVRRGAEAIFWNGTLVGVAPPTIQSSAKMGIEVALDRLVKKRQKKE